jgi:hypothetical protein
MPEYLKASLAGLDSRILLKVSLCDRKITYFNVRTDCATEMYAGTAATVKRAAGPKTVLVK